jgi:Protein of unknown function (DUF3800)
LLTIYFDDSGTHAQSPVAIAAGYVTSDEQWDYFSRDWNRIRGEENLPVIHMADYNRTTGAHALERLIGMINVRIRMGFAAAVPKDEYDANVEPDRKLRHIMGSFHYSFAVKLCLSLVKQWKEQFASQDKIRYVFDQMSEGRGEIVSIFREFENEADNFLGVQLAGYEFRNKNDLQPLQAADVLAWHVYRQMTDCVIPDRPEQKLPSTKSLERGNLKTHYFRPGQLTRWCEEIKEQPFYRNLVLR